jgi:hypothetical protein
MLLVVLGCWLGCWVESCRFFFGGCLLNEEGFSIFVRDFFTVSSEALVGALFLFHLFVYVPGLNHNLYLLWLWFVVDICNVM